LTAAAVYQQPFENLNISASRSSDGANKREHLQQFGKKGINIGVN